MKVLNAPKTRPQTLHVWTGPAYTGLDILQSRSLPFIPL